MTKNDPILGWTSAGLVVAVALALLAGFRLVAFLTRDLPVAYEDMAEQFKYGSIGAESALGIPRPIFEVLPDVFEDLLPPGAGRGYERLGFTYEPGHGLPVGTSERQRPIPLVGLNCAACHAGTLRQAPGEPRALLLGAPATRFDAGAFFQFLVEVGSDPRFEADRLFAAMESRHRPLGWSERMAYRLVVIPGTKRRLLELRRQLSWIQARPAFGPGRVDAVNPDKVLLGMDLAADDSVGTTDFPALYDQRLAQEAPPHWSFPPDPAADRVIRWSRGLQPPVFPRARIDLARAELGRAIWKVKCADCHAPGGRLVGRVTPITDVGTDPERLAAFTDGLAARLGSAGETAPRPPKVDGYLNAPLDGVWVRAPYLHNGSIPTLSDLLSPAGDRPEVFFRGYDAFDWERVGYVSSGPEAEKEGFRYDTRLRGNRNTGHLYGTDLSGEEKAALLEYLKTL